MGVVKNLMVRVGADIRGVVQGMKSASSATSQARDSIQDSTGSIKKSIKSGFDGSRLSIRQYTQAVQQTRASHKMAEAEVERLKDQLGGMKSTWSAASAALAGLNPVKSLNTQVAEAEEALIKIEHRRKELEKSTAGATAKQQGSASYKKQVHELQNLNYQYGLTTTGLNVLKNKMAQLGKVKGFDADVSLDQMGQKIEDTENRLNSARLAANKAGEKLRAMGSPKGFAIGRILRNTGAAVAAVGKAAAKVAAVELKALWHGLKKIGSVVLRGTINGIRKIGEMAKRTSNGSGGLSSMVRQIRNIGVVSLGLRVAGGMFGRLRSIISSYISTNEELHAATAAMTQQLGQALEPAIRLVMAAMQQLMPVVQKVSTAINAVLKSIIGDIGDVQYAMNSLGTYGFDQITKADGQEETGSQVEQEQSKLVQKLTGWISELKNAFVSGDWDGLGKLVGESVNKAFGELNNLDVGEKLGTFANNLTTTLHSIFATIDFANIGQTAATLLGDGVANVDWNKVGETIGLAMTALPTVAVSFVQNTDWQTVGQSALTMLQSAMGVVTAWVQGEDWLKLGQSIRNFVEQTDWTAVPNRMMELLGTAFGGVNFVSIGDMVAQGFNWVIGGLNRVLTEFDWPGAAAGLATELNTLVSGFDWGGLGATLSNACVVTLQTIRSVISTFDWLSLGSGIAEGINNIDFVQILSDLAGSLSDILVGAMDLVLGFAEKLDWGKLGSDIWNGLCGIVTSIDWNGIISRAFELVGAAIGGATALIAGFFTSLWDSLVAGCNNVKDYWTGQVEDAGGNIWQGVLNGILDGAANVGNWIVTNIWEPFKKGFCDAFGIHSPSTKAAGWGGNIIQGLFGGILDSFANIGNWIKTNLWDPFKKAFEDAFGGTGDALGDIFEDVPGKLKKPLNGIIKPINSMLSAMVAGINGLIRALNAIKVDIPNWGIFGELAGKSFGFNLKEISAPQIPELARGGIVDGPTQLIAGEKGKEAIVPLENNTEWIDKVADKISTRQVGGGTGQPMIIQVFLGKRKLTEYVIQDINQITKSTGVCPIKV